MLSESRLLELLKAIDPDTKRLPPGMLIFARAVETEVQGKLTRERFEERQRESAPVRIDIERMQAALDSESITIPNGLTREEIAAFILSHADEKPLPSYGETFYPERQCRECLRLYGTHDNHCRIGG